MGGGGVGNNGKLTKPLKYIVNGNCILEYDTQLAPLDAPSVVKMFIHKPWCLNSRGDLIMQKNLKGKWVVLYGIEVSTPYGVDQGTVATYGFFSCTNHEGQTIRERRKEFCTERGKSVHSPRFVFNGKYNRKIRKMLYSYQ